MWADASIPPEMHQLSRRKWLLSAMLASLAAAYGTLTSFALRFIFPDRITGPPQRVFLGFTHDLAVGESRAVRLRSGDQLLLSNSGQIDPDTGNVFLAFSNRCPHLGCKVHWESQENCFYCPCHQGVFDPAGRATSGPPADSGKNLKPYRLEIKGKSIYVVLEQARMTCRSRSWQDRRNDMRVVCQRPEEVPLRPDDDHEVARPSVDASNVLQRWPRGPRQPRNSREGTHSKVHILGSVEFEARLIRRPVDSLASQ